MKGKMYLVTGGSGFIGSNIVRSLLESGAKVRVFDDNSRGNARRLIDYKDKIEVVSGDIRNYDSVNAAMHGVSSVCHLAYINGTKFFYSHPELVLDVAIRGMINVVDGCRQNDVKELFVASSSEVYQTPDIYPTPENVELRIPDVLNKRYSYGGGKILCELMAMTYGRKDFERVVIFRPHNVYGPDMGWEHVIPEFILQASKLSNLPKNCSHNFKIKGSGEQTRSFVYIEDFCEGLMRVIQNGDHLGIYNIGTSEEITIEALARIVASKFVSEVKITTSIPPSGETNRRCPDVTKLSKLGFQPKVSLHDGIKKTVDWYLKNLHLKNV